MLLGGATVNALAFSGSNYLFSMLRSSGVDEERRRHDKAVEQLQSAHEEWSKARTKRLDWINEELRRQNHAVQTFRDVDATIREYARVTGQNLDSLGSEPQLTDYYTPSDWQKSPELIFVALGLGATGVLAYKLAKDPNWPRWTRHTVSAPRRMAGDNNSSEAGLMFPQIFLLLRYNDTWCHGIAGRAILCYARGRPLRPPSQNSWSGPHNGRYCTKVPLALARWWKDHGEVCAQSVGRLD